MVDGDGAQNEEAAPCVQVLGEAAQDGAEGREGEGFGQDVPDGFSETCGRKDLDVVHRRRKAVHTVEMLDSIVYLCQLVSRELVLPPRWGRTVFVASICADLDDSC